MYGIRFFGFGLALAMLTVSFGALAIAPANEQPQADTPSAATEHPYGWTHRPVLEHFTGLSCPPCMNGAHPDATRLWEEEGYSEGYPWTYIEFHELNGGGEDDLMTDDSRERMRFYQPGVSGTPSLEADGGYVQLGGSHGSTADANYDDMKQALQDSGERDAIKKVNLFVGTIYDGTRFKIKVDVDYLQNDEPLLTPTVPPEPREDTLTGQLHVFMIEDHVTAWSATMDEYVTTHNVFREYAIQDRDVELEPGENDTFYADWDIPTTMVRDGAEEPIRVPVNPANVYPVAVLYNRDDTSSGRGDGSENNDADSPRALNSATPQSTAFDLGGSPPIIELKDPTSTKGKVQINAVIEDDSGELVEAFVIYREAGQEDQPWSYRVLTIDGEECHGDVCTLGSGEAYAVLNLTDDKKVEYSINAYDGEWTRGTSEMAVAAINDPDDDEFPALSLVGLLAFMVVAGFIYWANQPAKKPEDGILDAEQ